MATIVYLFNFSNKNSLNQVTMECPQWKDNESNKMNKFDSNHDNSFLVELCKLLSKYSVNKIELIDIKNVFFQSIINNATLPSNDSDIKNNGIEMNISMLKNLELTFCINLYEFDTYVESSCLQTILNLMIQQKQLKSLSFGCTIISFC